MVSGFIVKALQKATNVEDLSLTIPEYGEQGDYTSNLAMQNWNNISIFDSPSDAKAMEGEQFSNKTFNSPRELAEAIKEELSKDIELSQYVSRIEIAGPGFINFFLSESYLVEQMSKYVISDFDIPQIGNQKKVIVEYSSPNIAKPFSIGHLRSTIIGDAIASLMEAVGYQVYRDNHLGDWGTQFGKQIYAIKTWGNLESIEKSDNPVRELVDLYVKYHEEAEKDKSLDDKAREWFKKLEDGDEEARRIWKMCIDWSWAEFDRIYKLLGVEFSPEFDKGRGLGESYFEDKMQVVIDELEDKDLLKEGEKGAKLVFFPDDKYPPAMILKGDGATLYHTRDLAADRYRLDKFGRQLIIVNEVGMEQSLYFRQLFEIEKMLGWVQDCQRIHVPHGLVRFKDGKMSTRKGNVIWLEEIIEEAKAKAFSLTSRKHNITWGKDFVETKHKKLPNKTLKFSEISSVHEIIAIGAIKWNDLKRDPKTEIVFDWDEILNMEGNSGPYMQYTYARARSVLLKYEAQNSKYENNRNSHIKIDKEVSEFDIRNSNLSKEESELLRSFSQYNEVIVRAAKNYSPNLLCSYLYDLAQKFNSFYNAQKIVGGDNEEFRLMLTSATANTLKHGLTILGIESPEKM